MKKRFRFRRRGGKRGNSRPSPRTNNLFSPHGAMQSMSTRLVTTFGLVSTAGGIVANVVPCDPFASSFTEYTSDWVNLFNQFRLLGSRIQIVTTIETKGDVGVLGIGYQNRSTGLATPTSLNNVVDNQPSWLWAPSSDTSALGFTKAQRVNNILFAATSASANTSTDSAGAPGGWQFYGTNFPASTQVGLIKFEIWLQFRSRS